MTGMGRNSQYNRSTGDWPVRLGNAQRNASLLLCLVTISLVVPGCLRSRPAPTEDPQASVVRLRNDLINFAKGNLDEITGSTGPEESYILIYGYQEYPLNSLPISESLQKKLEAIWPRPTEMHVLVHVYGDDIKEYTEWELNGPNYHPYLSPTLFMIRGNPFRITKKESENHRVVMEIK
ncbi:MAG TPA: hypothetical protein VNO70_18855 [Blastocatellia bacterium]|nr:hypothetical protein [Blastocatellia bacterium]